jgi:hypothetical protein
MRNETLLRTAFIAAAAGLLVAGIYAAAIRGLADAHYTRARLSLPAGAGKTVPLEAVMAAQSALQDATRLEPSNPMFLEQSARLRELRAVRLDPNDPAMREMLNQSLAEMRSAARMRPGSPFVWAGIALLKARLAEIDAEFSGALERAGRLGPWEPQVQIALADIGFALWSRLAPDSKATVLAALERGLLREAPAIRRLTIAHGTLPLICAGPALPPRVTALCVKR